MITVSYINIVKIILLTFLLSMLNNVQYALKPESYFSSRSSALLFDPNRATLASFTKILISIFVCLVFHYFSYSNIELIISFIVKEFLQIWTAITQVKIFSKWNKFKLRFFVSCIFYFTISVFYAWWTIYQFLPTIFNDKSLLYVSNDSISLLITICLYIFPLPLNYAIIPSRMEVKYTDIEALHADIHIVLNQIELETAYVSSYEYEIENHSKDNNIPKELLDTIIRLEYSNRSLYIYRLLEILLVKLFKKRTISKDYSIGIAQIKPSTAKDILKKSPYEFLEKMINNNFSIKLCAKLLRNILDEYTNEYNRSIENDWYDFDEDIFSFIASKYLCGCNTSYRRNTLIYESILATKCKYSNIYNYLDINAMG